MWHSFFSFLSLLAVLSYSNVTFIIQISFYYIYKIAEDIFKHKQHSTLMKDTYCPVRIPFFFFFHLYFGFKNLVALKKKIWTAGRIQEGFISGVSHLRSEAKATQQIDSFLLLSSSFFFFFHNNNNKISFLNNKLVFSF